MMRSIAEDKIRKIKETTKRAGHVAAYLGLICELLVSPSGYAFGFANEAIVFAGIVLLGFAVLCNMDPKKDLIPLAIAGAYSLLCLYFQHSALVLRCVLAVFALGREKKDTVVRLFFFGSAALTLLIFIKGIFGIDGELYVVRAFRHTSERRFTFGFAHPNAFSYFWFRLFIMWIYLYGLKTKTVKLAAGAAAFLIPFLLASSKMGIAIFVYMMAVTVFLRKIKNEKARLAFHRLQIALTGLMIAFIISFLFVPYPENNMGEVHNLWDVINEVTTGRMEHARDALLDSRIPLFGVAAVENGTEIGYVNSLLKEGAVYMLLYLLLTYRTWIHAIRTKKDNAAVLILGFMLYSVAEAFIPYYNKNGIFMMIQGTGDIDGKEKDKD